MSKRRGNDATYQAILKNRNSPRAIKLLSDIPPGPGTLERIPVGTPTLGTKAVVEVYQDKDAFYVRAIANTTSGPVPYKLDSFGPYPKRTRALKRAMTVAKRIVLSGFPHPKYWVCR